MALKNLRRAPFRSFISAGVNYCTTSHTDAVKKVIEEKRLQSQSGGGVKRIDEQHRKGKLTARERVQLLFDPGSFIEYDAFVEHDSNLFGMDKKKHPGDSVITGRGLVNGRDCYVFSQDFTVLGGSVSQAGSRKIVKVLSQAISVGAPFVNLNDSGGARITEGVASLAAYADIMERTIEASGVIPQIAMVMGPCAGGAAYAPVLNDFVFMVKDVSSMYVTGPEVIKAVTNESVDQQSLGGSKIHAEISGVAHGQFENDVEALTRVRDLLSYLPQSNLKQSPRVACDDPWDRSVAALDEIIPVDRNMAYEMKDVIRAVVDEGETFEIHADFAKNMVTCFARLNGRSVGVFANNPKYFAGCIDLKAALKAARFIRFCDAFNIPLVSFVDVPGFLPGLQQELNGIIRYGAKLLYAVSEATVPKVCVYTRKVYGGSYVMNPRQFHTDIVYAWPTAEIAVMGASSAANILFRNEPNKAEKILEYDATYCTPFEAAKRGYIDDIIEPRSTRKRLCLDMEALATKQRKRAWRKHGNIPL